MSRVSKGMGHKGFGWFLNGYNPETLVLPAIPVSHTLKVLLFFCFTTNQAPD